MNITRSIIVFMLVIFVSLVIQSKEVSASEDITEGFISCSANDYKAAYKVWRKEAEKGVANAQFCIGKMYELGVGVTKNHREAFKWFKMAAAQGNDNAQLNLGYMYARGEVAGIGNRDAIMESLNWFRKAADKGNCTAQYTIGSVYLEGGGGVTKSDNDAAKWLIKAAKNGGELAQVKLCSIYSSPYSPLQNNFLGHIWCNIAAANGSTYAAEDRDKLEAHMNQREIIEAQQIAKVCLESKYKNCPLDNAAKPYTSYYK